MGNGPQVRLPGGTCSFSDMGRMPHSERAPPSSGTAALRFFPSPASKNPCGKRAKPAEPQPGGQSTATLTGRATPSSGTAPPPLLPHPARKNPCGKRAKPAEPQPGGRISGVSLHYASTTISSFVSRAVCTSPSIFSSRFFSCLRITFRFGLVTGCFATKIVQQSSYGRIDVS